MKITMTETVASVTNCYRRGRTYDLPESEARPILNARQATPADDDEPETGQGHRRRTTMVELPSRPVEQPPAAEPVRAEPPAAESQPTAAAAAVEPENPLVPKAAAAAKPAGKR
jgi:hypothetical protein